MLTADASATELTASAAKAGAAEAREMAAAIPAEAAWLALLGTAEATVRTAERPARARLGDASVEPDS